MRIPINGKTYRIKIALSGNDYWKSYYFKYNSSISCFCCSGETVHLSRVCDWEEVNV